jgi:hypothetical protein
VAVENGENSDQIQPDYSVWIEEKYSIDPLMKSLPFLVVESAVSQRLRDLERKMDFWAKMGVPYVIGFNRDQRRKEIDILLIIDFVHLPIKTFKFGQEGDLDFHMSKHMISLGYDIKEFDLNPTHDDIHIILEPFDVK